ncbi:DUF6163 family protein [Mesorhizobium xinjiangense]|uniref:DUF6163 family protein n=1 Tax=Mesorhizobium xinjiangense TaxID=2678685 RepID=UPI0012EE6699|nr:DUF6163 family protein [Mesorhizobium xinjiangense]
MTEDGLETPRLGPTLVDSAFVWFLRIVAAFCLVFGILYWVRLVGFYDGLQWRFDTMPVHWQVAAVSLAVLFPFAGIGLWMMASWGPVIWFLCAAIEAAMYAGFPELFGHKSALVVAHVLVAALYIAFRVAIHFERRKEQALTQDSRRY